MNFFGHLVAAQWVRPSPRFGLGAMLPDLLGMCGAVLAEPHAPELRDGMAFHQRTDAAFHDLPAFAELCTAARRWLGDAGLPRGPVLAAAHVGVELMLDGALARDEDARRAFADALAAPVAWRSPGDATAFAQLHHGLAAADLPRTYADTDALATRLDRVLHRRPRLRPPPGSGAVFRSFADTFAPRVHARAPELTGQLRQALTGA